MQIKTGDRVQFKPEWQDAGDDKIEFRAIEDSSNGRVSVVAMLGLSINPVQTVTLEMIATAGNLAN